MSEYNDPISYWTTVVLALATLAYGIWLLAGAL